MKILLGSLNISKKKSLEKACEALKMENVEICTFNAPSGVPDKPIGFEILRGCENRNKFLRETAKNLKIEYDYLCSIEGGFALDEDGLPFVVTYAILEDKFGEKSTGKSLGLRLNREFYEYIRANNSLNEAIENILSIENNKQKEGITGYLSNGIYARNKVDTDAVLSAFIPLIFKDKYRTLLNYINKK